MKVSKKIFLLYADCIPVKGYSRSIIYDLGRNKYKFISNSLCDILLKYEAKTIEEIKNIYNYEENDTIDEYFNFLIKNEFIFFCNINEKDNFPKIKLDFKYPALISNAIIDINNKFSYNINDLLNQLEELGCRDIQVRIFNKVSIKFLKELIKNFSNKGFRNIELAFKYVNDFNLEELKLFVKENGNIGSILIYNSPYEKIVQENFKGMKGIFLFISRLSEKQLPQFKDNSLFNVSLKYFIEAKYYNPYFNMKITIDSKGNILNYPGGKVLGVVGKNTIIEVIRKKKYKILSNLNKDKINVCKECEYRYMCFDNRCPILNSKGEWEYKEECYYNPYKNVWKAI